MKGLLYGYQGWQPKHQVGVDGIIELTQWLASPASEGKSFCVIASSMVLNQSNLQEAWQITPSVGRYPFVNRLINLAQVDSVNGAPFENIRNCDLALVATPLQTHLSPAQQVNVKILQEEILDGNGIGTAFSVRPEVFSLDGIQVHVYQRVRSISHADYEKLVDRYYRMKGTPVSNVSEK
jgi:hypothetical protein